MLCGLHQLKAVNKIEKMLFAKNVFNYKWAYLFFVWTISYIIINYLTNEYIMDNAFYYSVLNERLGVERINSIVLSIKKLQWLGYCLLPLILFFKCFIISGIIFIGSLLFNQELPFRICFKIILLAEVVLIAAAASKATYFMIYKPETIEAIQIFYPLSVVDFFKPGELPVYMIYPLQQFNLFEGAYWVFITAGIQANNHKPFLQSFKITAASYGVASAIWVLCVVFIQLQMS